MKDKNFQNIYKALSANNLAEAKLLIDRAGLAFGKSAELYYLKGKVHMRESEWTHAMSCFLKAEEIEPNGPAHECLLMLNDIMEFYNKDMFNQ